MSDEAKVEKRDEFLRQLARAPGEGLRQWSRITETERVIVVTYMTVYYDTDFASTFLKVARSNKRPDLYTLVTNDPTLNADRLKKAGYKLRRDDGSRQTWVHPSGKEVWLLPPPKTFPTVAPGSTNLNQQPREHPDVEETRLYADDLKSEQDELLRQSRELRALKASLPAAEYKRRHEQWTKDYEEWEERYDEVVKTIIPGMTGTLTKDEAEAKQKEVERLNGLTTMAGDFFPPLPE